MRRTERGQVLPLFALMLVALMAITALAFDVSNAYAARRAFRTAADAAALAGALDLQVTGTRQVNPAQYSNARTHAEASLENELHDTVTCGPVGVGNKSDCTFATLPYQASIVTPLPSAASCGSCDPDRSVQVSVGNPSFTLTFARAVGLGQWRVAVTSVAGLTFKKSYAVITLRPPKKLGSTFDVNDIVLAGGSTITVSTGDVGSNANMNYTNTGGPTPSKMILDTGYRFFYYPAAPPDNDPGWVPPFPADPIGSPHTQPITDPGYNYPAMRGSLGSAPCASGPANCAPTFSDARTASCGAAGATPACSRADLDPACLTIASTKVPSSYTFMPTQLTTPSKIFCYNPGIYATSNSQKLSVGPADLVILTPGAYYFKSGLDVGGRLIGGYEAGAPGVALMFDECNNQCTFSGNNALTITLNAGSRVRPPGSGGAPATAAIDWNNQPVQTSGPSGPTPPILLTLLVNKDTNGPGGTQGCVVPTSPPFVEPNNCNANQNQTIQIAGGGSTFLQGVQYMPTDNVAINGGSTGIGIVGQIISWTLTYTGGTTINQEGAASQGPGLMRLDEACTAPGTPCVP